MFHFGEIYSLKFDFQQHILIFHCKNRKWFFRSNINYGKKLLFFCDYLLSFTFASEYLLT